MARPYALLAAPSAQRELDGLPGRIADGLRTVLAALAADPTSPRFDVRPLRGTPGRPPPLPLRVGEYRVIFQVDHKAREILIARIGHRSSVYRGLPQLDE